MNLKKFTTEIVKEWNRRPVTEGLNKTMGTPLITINKDTGLKGEKTALEHLQRKFEKDGYKFTLTDYSKTPADIIGYKRTSKYWHFVLYQVKTSKNIKKLTPEISEKYSLPVLADIVKDVFKVSVETNYHKQKGAYITLGYLGIRHSKKGNRVVKKVAYDKERTLNGLSLSYSEKQDLKKLLHT
ncbi:hypothetical protein [Kordia sp.]|uniref:hypothetical protein n=1 Tax=Kordia sp. TaxID=1965332 RepID=UPI003D2AA302